MQASCGQCGLESLPLGPQRAPFPQSYCGFRKSGQSPEAWASAAVVGLTPELAVVRWRFSFLDYSDRIDFN